MMMIDDRLAARLARIRAEAIACGDICMVMTCREAMAGDDDAIEAISEHFGFDIREFQ